LFKGAASWSCGSGIYNRLCYQCLSLLPLRVRTPLWRGVLDTTLFDEVCQWLATGRWFTPGTPVSSINKTDCHDIAKMLLKVAFNTINLNILFAIVFTFLYDWLELKWKKQISHCRNSSKTQTKNHRKRTKWIPLTHIQMYTRPLTFMSWYRHFNESVWIKVIL
jgi:hypothetical protein